MKSKVSTLATLQHIGNPRVFKLALLTVRCEFCDGFYA
jgi:hypothetical protein